MRSLPATDQRQLNAWKWQSLAVGLIGLAVVLVGSAGNPARFCRSYLAPYLFCLGLTLGSMALLMIYHLTGGAWGFLIRRVLEAGMRTLPFMAVLFLPIAFGVGEIYPWARPTTGGEDEALRHAHPYLNIPGFWGRAAAYFAVWLVAGFALGRCARRQELTGDQRLVPWLRTLSGFGLLAYGVGMNFASVDWVMSLAFPFHSTIFGPLMASTHLLSSLALAVVVLGWLSARPPLERAVSPDALNDLGSLLFAFVVVWSYMAWFQFMLVWIANLPTDVIWFAARSQGIWPAVVWLLFVLGFVTPLLLLLMRKIKRDPAALVRVAILILVTQLVYAFYLVLPSFAQVTIGENWMAPIALVGVGGLWSACFLWQLGRFPVLPRYDFNQNEALRLRRKNDEQTILEEALAHE